MEKDIDNKRVWNGISGGSGDCNAFSQLLTTLCGRKESSEPDQQQEVLINIYTCPVHQKEEKKIIFEKISNVNSNSTCETRRAEQKEMDWYFFAF